jgi:hypothetical protein
MTRDQKPRLQTKTPKSASRGSTLVGIFVGLILGALVAAGIALYFTSSSPFPKARQDDKPAPAPQPPKPASEPIALPGKPGDKPVEKPRFDFYNVLPKGSDALPAPEKPEETTEIVKPEKAKADKPKPAKPDEAASPPRKTRPTRWTSRRTTPSAPRPRRPSSTSRWCPRSSTCRPAPSKIRPRRTT